jgi:hypothetical protein
MSRLHRDKRAAAGRGYLIVGYQFTFDDSAIIRGFDDMRY